MSVWGWVAIGLIAYGLIATICSCAPKFSAVLAIMTGVAVVILTIIRKVTLSQPEGWVIFENSLCVWTLMVAIAGCLFTFPISEIKEDKYTTTTAKRIGNDYKIETETHETAHLLGALVAIVVVPSLLMLWSWLTIASAIALIGFNIYRLVLFAK